MADQAAIHEQATSKRGLAWGLTAQLLSVGIWAVMLPVILRYVSRAAVGVWFVFLSVSALVQLLEMGFQYVLARNFSYVYAGARKLHAVGVEPSTGPLDEQLLHALLAASRRIYALVGVLAAVLFGTAGTFYVWHITPSSLSVSSVLWSWAAFSAAYVITLYSSYFTSILHGRGDIQVANQVTVIAKITQLVVSLVLVAAGLGLVGLGIGVLSSAVVSRYIAMRCVYAASRTELARRPVPHEEVAALIRTLWHNASRYGLVLLGAFLIAEANVLIASWRIGVVATASYSLAVQILMVGQTVAALPFNLSLPRLSHLQASGDVATTNRVFSTAVAASLLCYVVFGTLVLGVASPMLGLLGASTHLPDRIVLAVMVTSSFLEVNHGMCGNFIATRNEIPFARAAIITGVSVALLGWFAAPRWGILGVVVVTACCQAVYNNWKWPSVAARQLGAGYFSIVARGVRAIIAHAASPRWLRAEIERGAD